MPKLTLTTGSKHEEWGNTLTTGGHCTWVEAEWLMQPVYLIVPISWDGIRVRSTAASPQNFYVRVAKISGNLYHFEKYKQHFWESIAMAAWWGTYTPRLRTTDSLCCLFLLWKSFNTWRLQASAASDHMSITHVWSGENNGILSEFEPITRYVHGCRSSPLTFEFGVGPLTRVSISSV